MIKRWKLKIEDILPSDVRLITQVVHQIEGYLTATPRRPFVVSTATPHAVTRPVVVMERTHTALQRMQAECKLCCYDVDGGYGLRLFPSLPPPTSLLPYFQHSLVVKPPLSLTLVNYIVKMPADHVHTNTHSHSHSHTAPLPLLV